MLIRKARFAELYEEGKKEAERTSLKFCTELFNSLYKTIILEKLERGNFARPRDLTGAWESFSKEYKAKVTLPALRANHSAGKG